MSCQTVNIARLTGVQEQKGGEERRVDALAGLVSEITCKYWVFGQTSLETARTAFLAYLSNVYADGLDGLPLHSFNVSEPSDVENGGAYEASATFKPLTETETAVKNGLLLVGYTVPAIKESQISLSGGGDSEHIDFGESHVWSGRDDEATPYDYAGAIDYYQGNIGGYDRPTPGNGSVKIVFPVPKTYFKLNNREKFKLWTSLIGCVNSDAFADFDAGCLLFESFECVPTTANVMGDGSNRAWYFSVNLTFSVKMPRTYEVGDNTYTKEGQDYAWWSSTRQTYTAAGTGLYVPVKSQLNIEQVYPRAAFSAFGLTFEE